MEKGFPNGFTQENERGHPWVEQELDEESNLLYPGTDQIGSIFEVKFSKKDNQKILTTRGVVAHVEKGLIILQDAKTGSLIQLNGNHCTIHSVVSMQTTDTPTEFHSVISNDVLILGLRKNGPIFGQCVVSGLLDGDWTTRVIAGELRNKKIREGYEVVQVTDANGTEHLIDPNFCDAEFTLTEKAEDVVPFIPNKDRLVFADLDRQERLDLANRLVKNLHVLDDESYYHYFERNVPRAKAILKRWYGDPKVRPLINDAIAQTEKTLGPERIALLADPGILQNFKAFLRFSKELIADEGTIPTNANLRDRFKKQLGTARVYRGMMLTRDELSRIMTSGIHAPGFGNEESASSVIQNMLSPSDRTSGKRGARSYRDEITGRLTDLFGHDTSLQISVSSYEDVAGSVGYFDSGHMQTEAKEMYVLECEVPKLSLIRLENFFNFDIDRPRTKLTIGNREYDESEDIEIEMFIPFAITSDSIKRITRLDGVPPRWTRHW